MSDRIIIRDLQVFARHGVLPEEAVLGQRFAVDITAHLDLRPAGRSDDLALSVSYADMVARVLATLTERRFALLEAAAEAAAEELLSQFPAIESVEVELRKPAAPIDAIFGHVGVAITRRRDARGGG